jgi:hypothetical protein
MTSEAKIEANRRNSLKSTGPRTPEGLSKSSMNALKHGMRSRMQALLREESIAFENRLRKWVAIADPDDDIGEFLVHQQVALSFQLDRVRRAQLERVTSQVEDFDDTEIDVVYDLGKRLFFDPAATTSLYGRRPDDRTKQRTSSNGEAVNPDDPAVLVDKLESSQAGRLWLRERWEELRARLEPDKFWRSQDRFKAIRLLGCQPLDAANDRRIAEIFMSSYALEGVRKGPFADLRTHMGRSAIEDYSLAILNRWPDLPRANEPVRSRQILIDLADQNVERLNAMLEEHRLNGTLEEHAQDADARAERTLARIAVDHSPEEQRLIQYQMKFLSASFRGLEVYRKYQRNKTANGARHRSEYTGPTPDEGRRRIPDAATWPEAMNAAHRVPNSSFVVGHNEPESFQQSVDPDPLPGLGPQPGCGTATAIATQSASADMTPENALSEGVTHSADNSASADVTLSDGITPEEAAEPEAEAVDAVANRAPQMSLPRENSENATNEANLSADAIITQNESSVGVAANFTADSGLDKRQDQPRGADAREERLDQRVLVSSRESHASRARPPDRGG